jgi:hypothetical protein
MQTTMSLQQCPECQTAGLSHIEIKVASEVLVCSPCLGCGRTSWSHDGQPTTTEDILSTVGRFWQMPWTRRSRNGPKQPATVQS